MNLTRLHAQHAGEWPLAEVLDRAQRLRRQSRVARVQRRPRPFPQPHAVVPAARGTALRELSFIGFRSDKIMGM